MVPLVGILFAPTHSRGAAHRILRLLGCSRALQFPLAILYLF